MCAMLFIWLQVFTAGGYFREAASLFQDMQAGGVEPTEETYLLLMLACGEGGCRLMLGRSTGKGCGMTSPLLD